MSGKRLWQPCTGTSWKLAALFAFLGAPTALAQQPCATGVRVEGSVTDSTGAVIPDAQVQAADGEKTTSDASGFFVLPCVPASAATLTGQAAGFASQTAKIDGRPGGVAQINLQLAIAQVETDVQVSADSTPLDPDHGAATKILTAEDVAQLPDDPDDLLLQLQLLASTGGGGGTPTIVVDGFQNGSATPPKSSIASIRVNPDAFSSEYEQPTDMGGRIEIITKPGTDLFHGALFFTDSDGIFNATDPFSVTATPASKQRYGFELSGPVVPKKGGFALALEKRDINEFNVVNAVTLDANDSVAVSCGVTCQSPRAEAIQSRCGAGTVCCSGAWM